MTCLWSSVIVAQQEAHYTHFMYNQQWLNPAYNGSKDANALTALFRRQWLGFDGAPVSQMVSYNAPFVDKRSGIGFSAAHFGIGAFNNWYANLGYSYAVVKTDKLQIRGGLQGVFRRIAFNPLAPEMYIPNRADPLVAGETFSRNVANFGAGLYALTNTWYAGVSCPGILQQGVSLNDASDTAGMALKRHFFGTAGAMIPAGAKFMIRPSVMLKYVPNAPLSFDVNAMAFYMLKFGLGVSYRTFGDGIGESIDVLAHFQVSRRMAVGMSYDYSLSMLNNVNSGSIEAFLRLEWGGTVDQQDLTNPRFFY
jgi:type IX secretion system PorP/SprF family membrane protein